MDEDVVAKWRKAGQVAGAAREYGASLIKENVTMLEVADSVEDFIEKKGANVAFPVNLAIDDHAAHFTPTHDYMEVFKSGQLVKLDVGAHVDGYIGDTAVTVEVSTRKWNGLIQSSRDALMGAISMVRPGVDLGEVGGIIENTIQSQGFKPVRNLTGHSMERYNLHAGLSIPNVREPVKETVQPGDVIAIEPFSTNGAGRVISHRQSNIFRLQKEKYGSNQKANELLRSIVKKNRTLPFSERWCARETGDPTKLLRRLISSRAIVSYPILKEFGSGMVAQTEHTMLVTENGCEVLTLPM